MRTKTLFFLSLSIFTLWSCEQETEPIEELALSAVEMTDTWQVLRFEDRLQNTVMSSPEDEEILIWSIKF